MTKPVNLPASYKNATGKTDFSLTNDYLFRAVFQKSRTALKGLICSVLHLAPEDVKSVEITNPIELGRQYDDKTFILDINVVLNDDSLINLEMQMENQHNWQDRSLSYLCRSFDQLYQQCRARRDYYKQINTYNRSLEQIKELEEKTTLLENENALLRKRIAELESQQK